LLHDLYRVLVPAAVELDEGHDNTDQAAQPPQPPLTLDAPQPSDCELPPYELVHLLVPHALPALLHERDLDRVLPVHVPEQPVHEPQAL
jgi:hypothetical protein